MGGDVLFGSHGEENGGSAVGRGTTRDLRRAAQPPHAFNALERATSGLGQRMGTTGLSPSAFHIPLDSAQVHK